MPDIMHLIRIEATPDAVYAAIATEEGDRRWWTQDADLDSRVGGRGTFRFYGGERATVIEVAALEPPVRVGWTVMGSFLPAWEGTAISFELQAEPDGAKLLFAHRGFRDADETYALCTTGWGIYLGRLKTVLEPGDSASRSVL